MMLVVLSVLTITAIVKLDRISISEAKYLANNKDCISVSAFEAVNQMTNGVCHIEWVQVPLLSMAIPL